MVIELFTHDRKILHTILPLLHELRHWLGKVVLVKVNSYTGCLLNERADEYAELGYTSDHDTLCHGALWASLWLRIRPNIRDLAIAKDHRQQLQSDGAPIRLRISAF